MDLAADFSVRRGSFTLRVQHTFPSGKVTALVGQNGAGKTTLLESVAGFLEISEGTLTAGESIWASPDARPPVHVPPHRRRAVLLPQGGNLFPHLTVTENVRFGPLAQGLPRQDQDRTVARWLGELDLEGLADRNPGELSGGQRARVALARALAASPHILLLDEPAAALDVGAADEFRRIFRDLAEQNPVTTLLVTHSPADVLGLADEVVLLSDGNASAGIPAQSLWVTPPDQFSAEFTGVNLLPGEVITTREGNRALLLPGGFEAEVPDLPADPGPYRVSFPRTAVKLLPAAAPDQKDVWSGAVREVHATASGFRVELMHPPGIVAHLDTRAYWDSPLRPGDAVKVRLDASQISVY